MADPDRPGAGRGPGGGRSHQQHRPVDPGGRLRAPRGPRARWPAGCGPGRLPTHPGRRRLWRGRGAGDDVDRTLGRAARARRPRRVRATPADRRGRRASARGGARQRVRRRLRRARRRRADHVARHDGLAAHRRAAGLPAHRLRHGDGHARAGRVSRRETVLVTGASGGVGLAAVQLAAARGCRVVAQTSAGKEDLVREAGADAVVDRRRGRPGRPGPRRPGRRDRRGGRAQVDALLPLVRGPAGAGWWPVGSPTPWCASTSAGSTCSNRRLIGSTMHTAAHFAALVEEARAGRSPRGSRRRTASSRSTRPTPSSRRASTSGRSWSCLPT